MTKTMNSKTTNKGYLFYITGLVLLHSINQTKKSYHHEVYVFIKETDKK